MTSSPITSWNWKPSSISTGAGEEWPSAWRCSSGIFQKALDDYIEGRIDERQFLKESEYFTRWGYDYHLYRQIPPVCEVGKNPCPSLNGRARNDREDLPGRPRIPVEEETRLIPSRWLLRRRLRKRLKDIFMSTKISERATSISLSGQILWMRPCRNDRSIPEGRAREYQIVFLAGEGHLAYARVSRRRRKENGVDYAILLNDVDV